MPDRLLRQWAILCAIPRAPLKIGVAALLAQLKASGAPSNERSIERDLQTLSRVFPLLQADAADGGGWSWSAESPAFDLPAMDGPSALALRMIEQFIPAVLPGAIGELLAPQFARARTVLRAKRAGEFDPSSDCVRIVPRALTLLPPRFNFNVVRVVYESLWSRRRFTTNYRSRAAGHEEMQSYEVNPLGLVVLGSLVYVVCTLADEQDVGQLALHRMVSAAPTDVQAMTPDGFDLDLYIRRGDFQFPAGSAIRLKAKFARAAALSLFDTPLSEDQVIEDLGGEHVLVSATVDDTPQLEWWLLGFGKQAQVVEPLDLKRRILERKIDLCSSE
jgi:predicted DNA-binding transcriptional regulator YafY